MRPSVHKCGAPQTPVLVALTRFRTPADAHVLTAPQLFATFIWADAAGRLGRIEKSRWCNCSPVQAAFANAS